MPIDEKVAPKTTDDLIRALTITVTTGFHEIGNRMGRIEDRQDEIETWRKVTSDRVRGVVKTTSEADLSHDAKIADSIQAHEALAKVVADLKSESSTQLAILGRLDKFASSTLTKRALQIIVTIGGIWLAMHAAPPAAFAPLIAPAAPVATPAVAK